MRVSVCTIFPELFSGFLTSSLIGKAIEKKTLEIELCNIRDFAEPTHYKVDDTPYGGGAGMVMKPEPLTRAVESQMSSMPSAKVVLLSPSGSLFDQRKAEEMSKEKELILVAGRYEGVDQRFIDLIVDEEISIGNYVLMGGEVAAMVVIEAVTRLVPGVVGNPASIASESFSDAGSPDSVEGPQYTRPPEFRNLSVPEVLLGGNHQEIKGYREREALKKTKTRSA